MKENLERRIYELSEKLKWQKRNEQARKEKQSQQKFQLKQNINQLKRDLKDKNNELILQTKALKEKENKIRVLQKEEENSRKKNKHHTIERRTSES